LDEILTGKHFATADDISNAKTELKGELATQESVTQLTNQAVTTAEGKVSEAKTELEGKISELKNTVDAIHAPDTSTLATKEELKTALKMEDINPILEVKQDKSSNVIGTTYYVGVRICCLKPLAVRLNGRTTEMEDGTIYPGFAGYYVVNDNSPIASVNIEIYMGDDVSTPKYQETLTIDPAKFGEDAKYIFIAETDASGNLVGRNITKAIKLEDHISDYNIKMDLKAATGTPTNLVIGITANSAGQESADLSVCSTLNGQYNLFEKTEFTEVGDKLNPYLVLDTGAQLLNGIATNQLKVFKLKTPLNPDGQNDTYVVTYHRPVNHG